VKPAVKLWDLIKPPFKSQGTLHIFDQNSFMCGMVRGWGSLQDYENGEGLQDELLRFIIDAMNEKFDREKPHNPEEPVECISCRYIIARKPGYYWCEKRGVGIDPYVREPCENYEHN
jgi:hypothetical protein